MLRTRIFTALVMLSALLSALFLLPSYGWALVVLFLIALASWEWGALAGAQGGARMIYCLATVAMLYACLGMSETRPNLDLERIVLGAGVAFWLLAVPLWLLRKWPIRKPWPGLLAGWFVLVPAGLALVQLHQRGGPWLLLAAMAPVWVADIAAYFVGRAIGRHKLAPGISPGKSWEGAIGGVLGVIIYGFVLAYAAPQLGLLRNGALLALGVFALSLVLLAAVSIIGDLFESLAKRQAGVKDSGRLLPGHGGLLDRIDSLTSTLPLVGLAIALWRP